MPESKPPRRSTSPKPSGPYDRRALLDAYQTLVKSEQERLAAGAAPPPAPPTRRPFWSVSLLLIAVLIGLLVLRPVWLFTPIPAEPQELMEASLRVQMFVEIERIERFRSDSGRIPSNAAEAAIQAGTALVYRATGGDYSLTGSNGPVTLTYSSTTPASTFLGNSYDIIRQRRSQ